MPDLPNTTPAVPEHLKWDLWLGPAAERPYSPSYCPYNWRFWWDFGTGETGNWGCHILDLPFWALNLKYPSRVAAEGPPVDVDRSPRSMTVRFDFAANNDHPPVQLHWYQNKQGPPILRERNLPKVENTVFVGSEGLLLCGFGQCELFPKEKFADVELPEPSIRRSPGFHREWLDACRGGVPATCDFSYSGPLAETVLLGNVAYRAGGGFDWDEAGLVAKGSPKAQQLLVSKFREGWEI